MFRFKNAPLISGTQFVAIIVLTITIFLVIDFGRRTTAGYYASQAEEQLQQEIQDLLQQQAELRERRDYVGSDQYVEEWARKDAHMARPGDQPLVLVTPQSPQARIELAQSTTAPPATPVPNWYRWWLLFFGD